MALWREPVAEVPVDVALVAVVAPGLLEETADVALVAVVATVDFPTVEALVESVV